MASPSKIRPPPHCQIRSAVNLLSTLTDDVNRSLAATATFAAENDLAAVVREAKVVRQNHSATSSLIRKKLEDSIQDINAVYEMNVELQKANMNLKRKVKDLEDEDLSFSQALISQTSVSGNVMLSQTSSVSGSAMFSQMTSANHNSKATFDEALETVSEDSTSLMKKQKLEKDN